MPEINFLAVLVAAVAAWLIGAVWYSPLLFGKAWAAGHGFSAGQADSMKARMPIAFIGSFVCYLVTALALAVLVDMTDATGAVAGVELGLLCWVGFAAAICLTQNLYTTEPFKVFAINTGYHLAFLIVMGAVLGAWR